MEQTEAVAQPTETPVAAADTESLAAHEASFGPNRSVERDDDQPAAATPTPKAAESADAEPGDGERDDKGRFKPRHRAKSQEASPEDVPRIRELTRRLRETEEQLEQARKSSPAPKPEAPKPAATAPSDRFPSFEEWAAQDGNTGKTWEDYADARSDWRYDMRRKSEREQEAREAGQREFAQHVEAYRKQIPDAQKKYPDFDEVMQGGDLDVSKAVEFAAIQVGPEAAYYLATHRDEMEALTQDTAVAINDPAFPRIVAMTVRHLRSLVASQQRSSSPSRDAAVKTGSALALVSQNTPKPPNPVRTGAMRDADAPPSDESSLAEHERAYGPKRRRA